MSRPQTSSTSKRDEITDDDSINSRSIAGVPQEILGVVAADGVKVLANANGHIDLDELKKHQKTLHTALYTDEKEIDAAMMLETEYQREFDDAEVHIPFSHEGLHHSHILDFSEMPNLSQPVDHDHYDFHHQHEVCTEGMLSSVACAAQCVCICELSVIRDMCSNPYDTAYPLALAPCPSSVPLLGAPRDG